MTTRLSAPIFVSSGDPLLDRRYEWARGLIERGETAAAVDLLEETLKRGIGFIAAWLLLGQAQQVIGDREKAIAAFRRVLALDPLDRLGARLRLARLGEGEGLRAMSPAYVETLFDQYSGRFDKELVEDLGYRAPALLLAALNGTEGEKTQFSRVLDLGCGTGLMGEAIRSRAVELIGVDLSAKMIGAAEKKRIYDRLAVNDLVKFIEAEKIAFNLMLAADVFVYLPNLAPVLSAAAKKLTSTGLLAFTVETHDGNKVILRDTLRFAHSVAYLCAAADAAKFDILRLEKVSTRIERNLPVDGLLAVLRGRG
jgi:predicted TPR repeat methyltransferase